ncbi:hypothetical protein KC675_00805 [Candidatus Dojkabacteria bacterium]|uniref:Right-handed parallel beta-helix repeat-containing protein n=1 Tax=Candidatus Dojkabacteria bacterium TaxID=2099670 RepID=A0A955KZ95_9BACT|nr:hypothetical protein [Candidatus Dojkabacteria bacterium]
MKETLRPHRLRRWLTMGLLVASMSACDGDIQNLPATAHGLNNHQFTEKLPVESHFLQVNNEEQLYNAIELINRNADSTTEYHIEIAPGDYYLKTTQVEAQSKHLDDNSPHFINTGISLNCNSSIKLTGMEGAPLPRLIFDGLESDVGLYITGDCDIDISNIEIHTIPVVASAEQLISLGDSVVRSAIYLEGTIASNRSVSIHDVSLFDNVDRSALLEGNDIESTGIIIKHAERANLDRIRLERFYGDGVSFFNVRNAVVSNSRFLRDGARMRSGTAIGTITLTGSSLEGRDLDIEGYYKGMNIYPANGASVNGSSIVLKNSNVNNNGGEMFYIVNATNAITTLSNVQHTSPQGVVYPILQCNYADVISSSFMIANARPGRSYFDFDGVPYVVRANNISVLNSSISNSDSLPLQAIDILKAQGFVLIK